MSDPCDPALARVILGDLTALHDVAARFDDVHWTRVIAARATLLPPAQRSSDALLVTARLMAATTDADRAIAAHALATLLRQRTLDADRQHALIAAVAHDAWASAALIANLASCWSDVDAADQHALLDAAARHGDTAQQALMALGAAPPDRARQLLLMAARDPYRSADLIAALAPHWDTIADDARHALLMAAAQRADAARKALAALWHVNAAAPDDQRHALLMAVVHDAAQHAALMDAWAPHWGALAHADQHALITAAARDPHAAQRTLSALGAVVTAEQRHALLMTVIRDPDAIAALIDAWAPHWGALAHADQHALITAAARDPHAAQRALSALGAALPAQQRSALLEQVARSPWESAAVMAAWAPRWDDLAHDHQHALLHAAARHGDAAQQALAALVRAGVALPDDARHALLDAVASNAWVSACLIADLAPCWSDLDAADQRILLDAATRYAGAARRALAALDAALPDDWRHALLNTIMHDADAIADLIDDLAPRWATVSADVRDALLDAATRHADAAQRALIALGAVLPSDRRHALLDTVVHDADASADLIAAWASRWSDLDVADQAMLVHAAGRYADAAQQALVALERAGAALTDDWRRTLLTNAIRDPWAITIVIQTLAPRWRAMDDNDRNALLAEIATDPAAARDALVSLTPYLPPLDHALMLAHAAHPDRAWDALAAACAAAPGSDALALGILASVCNAPAPALDAMASAWHALTDAAQHAFVDALVANDALVWAFGRLVADADLALPATTRRALLRTLIPVHDALAALGAMAEPSDAIAAWLPPDDSALSDAECAAWRTALQKGALPLHVALAIAVITLHGSGARIPQSRSRA